MTYLETFHRHYIITALWSTTNVDNEEGDDTALDAGYILEDLSIGAFNKSISECADFIEMSGIEQDPYWDAEHAGHDFWLTRNRHGAGFWDRYCDFGAEVRDEVQSRGDHYTSLCRAHFPEVDIYPGDDGRLYF